MSQQGSKMKNFMILTAHQLKELLDNGTIKLENIEVNADRIQKMESEALPGLANMDNDDAQSENYFANLDSTQNLIIKNTATNNPVQTQYHNPKKVPKKIHVSRECLECDVKVAPKYLFLVKHYEEHHPGVAPPEKYKCSKCDFRTDVAASLKSHYGKSGHGTRLLRKYCNLCPYSTNSRMKIDQHMLKRHKIEVIKPPPKPSSYSCEICHREFKLLNNRDRHMLVHTGVKEFECPQCGKCFAQKSTMQLHVQTVHLKIPYGPWMKKKKHVPRVKQESMAN